MRKGVLLANRWDVSPEQTQESIRKQTQSCPGGICYLNVMIIQEVLYALVAMSPHPLLWLSSQYIDSADLEPETLQEEPVRYHEAWQKLCGAE